MDEIKGMTQFNVGDNVRVIDAGTAPEIYKNMTGIVKSVYWDNDDFSYEVEFRKKIYGYYKWDYSAENLKLVK